MVLLADAIPQPAPTLSIHAVAGSVVVSWPLTATGFTLQETFDLQAGSWITLTKAPTVLNNQYQVTLPAADHAFFRLTQ